MLVNFYSPECGHCNDLAPAWRELGSALNGFVTVAAVNCHDSWGLCHHLGIRAYPTVLRLGVGTARVQYHSHRSFEALLEFALEPFAKPRVLTQMSELDAMSGPKLLLVAGLGGTPLAATELPIRQIAAALHGILPVWELDCVAQRILCSDKGWEDNHARFIDNATLPFGTHFYPSDNEEWEDSFRVHTLVEVAIGMLPLPERVLLNDLSEAMLAHQHDALSPLVIGDGGAMLWHTISAFEACEMNEEGIVRSGSFENANNLEHCQSMCAERSGCIAIDFFSDTRWW